MFSLTLLFLGYHQHWTHSSPTSFILIVSYGVLAINRYLSLFLQTLLSARVLGYASREIEEYILSSKIATIESLSKTCRSIRAAIAQFTYRIFERKFYAKSLCANWLPAATPGQYAKSTKRPQPPREYESFHRHDDCRRISLKAFSSSSYALSTTLPWTIKLSLAVLWVSLYTTRSVS
jgi:hypothetical protein